MALGTLAADFVQSGSSLAPPKIVDSSAIEIGTTCRAWANFNGASGALRGSFNISSVTRTALGFYTIAMTNALPDANYAIVGSASSPDNTTGRVFEIDGLITMSTTGFGVKSQNALNNTYYDTAIGCLAVFR